MITCDMIKYLIIPFIIWETIAFLIPNKWIEEYIFISVLLIFIALLCTPNSADKQKEEERKKQQNDCPPTQVSDRFAKCITLVIISAFFLGIAFMITVSVCQYFDFTPKNHREAICLFLLIANMIVCPIAFFCKRQS